jgi:hypothetical protein
MSKVVTRRLFLAMGCLALCLVVVPAAEAVTYNVDCTALNGATSDPRINQQGNDVVVNCGLDVRTLIIRAHSITVNPPGFIRTAGLGGMNLYAGLDSMNTKCVDPDPATARININGVHLEDLNRNGGVVLKGCGDINVAPDSAMTSTGSDIRLDCLLTGCKVNVGGSFVFGNRILFHSQGDMTLVNNVFLTIGPYDQHTYVSYHGNLFAGEGCVQPAQPICLETVADACDLCQECHGHNSFSGGNESQFFAFAEKFIDLSGACVTIAETITITADGRDSVPPYANLPEPPLGAINLIDSEMRNDFGKTGHISITAHPALMKNGKPLDPDSVPLLPPAGFTGDGSINVLNAIFIDNGALEGPSNVSFMNGFRDSIPGNCNATPTCQQKAIPLLGFVADPNARASHNVLNAFLVRCDS